MGSRKSLAEVVTAWALVAVLLAGGFLLVLCHAPLLAAAGLTRDGAAATVAPTLFDPRPSSSVDAAGTGLVEPVTTPTAGTLPDRANLEGKLNALDTSKLLDQAKQPVTPAYAVVDVETGEIVAARSETSPLIPASNTKLLTAVAVMNHFSGDETFTTKVVQPSPGQLVLVGGGDPMLAAEPSAEGSYPRLASTRALAEQTAAALKASGQTSVSLGYDASLFTDSWAATWTSGYHSHVTTLSALWVNEGMVDQTRSDTPALDAAVTFASQLTEAGITVEGEPTAAAGSGKVLAQVQSPAVHVLVEEAMQLSNNSYTEILGFQLALATSQPATFAGSTAAIQAELTELGLWEDSMALSDASGLSRENRVSASSLAKTVRAMTTDPRLSVILDGLPTAGVTGTLATRFTDSISSPARGVAQGKTGTLNFVSTLAGTTRTASGRQLAFAFLANGQTDGWAARVWLDQATGTVTSCGCDG